MKTRLQSSRVINRYAEDKEDFTRLNLLLDLARLLPRDGTPFTVSVAFQEEGAREHFQSESWRAGDRVLILTAELELET